MTGKWWPCFICEVEDECPHREPELRAFIRGVETAPEVLGYQNLVEIAPEGQESQQWRKKA